MEANLGRGKGDFTVNQMYQKTIKRRKKKGIPDWYAENMLKGKDKTIMSPT